MTRFTFNLYARVDLGRAFAHDAEAKMSSRNRLWIKTATIVPNTQLHPIGLAEQRDVDRGRLGVFDRVVQSSCVMR